MYKVSLQIPVYNAVDYIERALLSALNQTFPSIEYLIIDDKGSDESMDIVRRIISEHPRGKDVRIIEHERNEGIGATRNTALDAATGEYFFFMDDDDEITLDCIELLYSKMQECHVDFVGSSFACRDLNGKVYHGCIYPDLLIKGEEYPLASYRYLDLNDIFIAGWNRLYDISFLKEKNIRCIPDHLNEDVWFTYQILLYAKSACLMHNITLF